MADQISDYPVHYAGIKPTRHPRLGVEVNGQAAVRYLRVFDGISVDVEVTVFPDRLVVELVQTADQDLPVLEAEAWRFTWSMQAAITGTMAEPTLQPGRNGAVRLPWKAAVDRFPILGSAPLAAS